jgi:hypothetical protein
MSLSRLPFALFGARRGFSSARWRQYFLPPIQLTSLLEGKPSPISPSLHPFIQHAVQMPWMLGGMTRSFGSEMTRRLIHITPARQALHEVIAGVVMKLRTHSTEHFDEAVNECYERCDMGYLAEQYNTVSRICLSQAEQAVSHYLNYSRSDGFMAVLINACREKGMPADQETFVLAYHDYATRLAMEEAIRCHVIEQLNDMIHEEQVEPLEWVPPDERKTYLVCGAAATGKGELLRRLAEEGVALDSLCRILVDEWHGILRDMMPHDLGQDVRYHGPLLYEEAVHIRQIVMQRLRQAALVGHCVPHTLMETTIPTPDKIQFATYTDGPLIILITTHQYPTRAIEGCVKRFEKTGRLVPLNNMIEGMQRLSDTLPGVMAELLRRPIEGVMIIHDTTYLHPAQGGEDLSPKTPVCMVDAMQQKIFIFDIAALLNLHAKRYLNTRSEEVEAIFAPLRTMTQPALIQSFKKHYAALLPRMVFVAPNEVDLTSIKHEEYSQIDFNEVAYASIEEGNILNIHHQERHGSIQDESEIARSFFASFSIAGPEPDLSLLSTRLA